MPKKYESADMMGSKLNYYCSYCGKLFHLKWQLTAHIRVHENRTPHICHICPATFVRNWDLKIHLKSHSNERPFQCKYCTKAFKTKFSKECHEDTHGVNTYKCSACEETFSTYMKLTRHKKRHKKSVVIKENGQVHYSCSYCSSFFLSFEFKKNHEAAIHHKTDSDKDDAPMQATKCPICFKKFANGKEYRSHVYEVHPTEADNLFYTKCTICSKRVSAAFYSYHMMAHNGIKPHACSVCDIKFTRKHDLLRHMDIHSEQTPFKCDKCPKKFKCKKNLNMHLKSHLKKDQFCDMCNKAFATREKLSNHRNRIHLRDQNLEKCTICEKAILNQYMSRHMKEFHCDDEKLCDHCGQTFKNAFKLRIHITKFCKETEAYKTKTLYQQHVRSHDALHSSMTETPDSLIFGCLKECFLCGFTFTHKKAFRNHLQMHDYSNWTLTWNSKNIYRRKKPKGKDKSKVQEVYLVKDVRRPLNLSSGLSRDAVITRYKICTNVKKEISWVPFRIAEDRKIIQTNQITLDCSNSNSSEVSLKQKQFFFTCNTCTKVNMIEDAGPNKLIYVCEYCSSVHKCVNNASSMLVNNSYSTSGIQLPMGIRNFNIGTTNILPLIILATPMQQNETERKLENTDPEEIKVEEPEIIIDENPSTHPAIDVKTVVRDAEESVDDCAATKRCNDSCGFNNETAEVSSIFLGSESTKNNDDKLKDLKEKLSVLQGKQFISVEDLKKLRDYDISTLLDYL